MSMCETVTSATSPTPPPDLLLNFRAMLRLGRKWLNVPNKHYTGFRFYDPTGKFSNIEKAGRFIHLYRQRRIEIHSWMRRRFIEDVLTPLKAYGAKWHVRRVKLEGHYVEIIEVTCGWYCILIALRNWCNPLVEQEVSRIVKAFDKHARETCVEHQYKVVWKCIIAPAFEHGQAKMERYRNFLHFFRMSYVVNQGLLDGIVRAAGTDYRYAYPSTGTWTTGAVDAVRGKLALFLGQEPTAAIDATEYNRMVDLVSRAHALRQHEPPPFCSGSDFAPKPPSSSSYIDPIMKDASPTHFPTSGLDPPGAQPLIPPKPSRGTTSTPLIRQRTASTTVPPSSVSILDMRSAERGWYLGELASKEAAQRRMEESWNRRFEELLDRIETEEFVKDTQHDSYEVRWRKFLDKVDREEERRARRSESFTERQTRLARTITNRYLRINFIKCLITNNPSLQRSKTSVTRMIRTFWGLNWRTAQEYCSVAFSMLHDNDETCKIRNVTNTRRKRIKHLYMKLLWDKNIQASPWQLVQYAMRLWGVRYRTAWDYEQAAWVTFNRKEDFLEDTAASNIKTTYRTVYLYNLALDHPHLAQEPIKLTQKAMSLWGIQRRTADILVNRVRAMFHSSPKEASR